MCIIDAEKIKRELDLEEEAINIGIKKYQEDKAKQEISELPPGRKLIQIAMTSMIQALEEFKSPKAGGGGRLVNTRKYLKSVSNEVLAFITVKKLVNCLYEPIKVQKVAIQLSQLIIDHMEYEEFKKDSPGYYRMLNDKVFPHSTSYYNKKSIIARARKKANLEHIVWPEEDRLHMGIKLIDMYIESTGLIERVRHPDDDLYYLHSTEKVRDWVEKQHSRCELLDPLYMPMVIPPKPWNTPFGGGYISNYATMKFKLIKSDSKQALEALLDKDLSNVYRAVNAVQDVPWRINQKLYSIMKEAWDSGTCLGGLPRQDEEPLPDKPWSNDDEFEAYKTDDPQVIRKWKNEATVIYLKRVGTRSKRISMIQKLWIAEKFLKDEEIYFVWTLDWRGRMYPVSTFIHPQADDTGKALLEFAKGKPLGERGAWWLAVHLANEYGYDKCSFDDRVKWTHEHQEQILDSA
jgi:DNA-directed RNA polymerase